MNASPLAHFARHWWVLLLYGLIGVGFGIACFVAPGASVVALIWSFGLMALFEGALSAVALFAGPSPPGKGWLALYALASLAFGALALLRPLAVADALLLLLAAWLVIGGALRIVWAIALRKAIDNEWFLALSGLLILGLGALMLLYPRAGLVTVVWWIGLGALLFGLLQIFVAVRVRRLSRLRV
uniref:HdeD family acid-resistance protein n=1 Tax=Lysobacter sp. RH2180-5 TaxID=1809648 RepID=A0A1B4ZA41_9GAMM|nr:hypothetical protein [Lysobacter sp. RH2180-5]